MNRQLLKNVVMFSFKNGKLTSIPGSFSLTTRDANGGEPGIEVEDALVFLFRDVSSALFVMSRSKNTAIGPLHVLVTWYKIMHTCW